MEKDGDAASSSGANVERSDGPSVAAPPIRDIVEAPPIPVPAGDGDNVPPPPLPPPVNVPARIDIEDLNNLDDARQTGDDVDGGETDEE